MWRDDACSTCKLCSFEYSDQCNVKFFLARIWKHFTSSWLHLESTQIIAWFLCYTVCLKEKEKKSNNFLTYCLVNFLVMNSLIFLSTNAPVAVILDLVMLWGKNSKIVFIVWGNNILINGKTNCNKNRDDPNARYIII